MELRDSLKSEKAKERYDRNFNSVETTFSQKELEEHDKQIRNEAITEFAERMKEKINNVYSDEKVVARAIWKSNTLKAEVDEIAEEMRCAE